MLSVVLFLWSTVFPGTYCKLKLTDGHMLVLRDLRSAVCVFEGLSFYSTIFIVFVIVSYSSMLSLLIQLLCCFILCCTLIGLLILHKTQLSGVKRLKGLREGLCQSSNQHLVSLPFWVAARQITAAVSPRNVYGITVRHAMLMVHQNCKPSAVYYL